MKVEEAKELSLEERYVQASADVEAHVAYMKQRREAFADPREVAQLERKHWNLLGIYAGLKEAFLKEQHG